jgi:type VI secretion system ImpA family protein
MLDREKLLAPIPGGSPAGPNLRTVAGDTSLAEIAEFRRQEDAAFDPNGRGKDSDWAGVSRTCQRVLAEKSKDLQVAAHLVEALCRTQGYPGAVEGMRLVRELLERYWNEIHPGVEDGEVIHALRSRWVSWLGSSNDFLSAVRSIPVTSGPGVPARSWRDYENSQRVDTASLQQDKKPYEEMIANGLITGADWKAAVASTPLDRLRAVVESIKAMEQEALGLSKFCSEKFPEDAPNLVDLTNLLGECGSYLQTRLGSAEPEPEPAATPSAKGAAPAPGAAAQRGGPITSRDEAFRRLREAADYLRRTEPHSPVPYLVDRAVGWGDKPFRDVLKDVLRDEKAFKGILETLGMNE